MHGESRWFRSPVVLLAGAALAVVLTAAAAIGSAAGPAADFSLFIGRFHPLAVHLPIGVIVLVVAAELAAFRPSLRARIDPVLGYALPALLVVGVAAFVLGHLLARDGGYPSQSLLRHQRLELVAMFGLCASVVVWEFQAKQAAAWGRNAYRAVLGATFLVLSAGAHFGANLTHGESYLTKYAPGPIRGLLGESGASESTASASASAASRAARAEPLVFDDVVLPLLDRYCVECHGLDKTKGRLRLDSLEALMKGGENGAALVAGDAARSEIVRRIRLPVDDDERMPPEGKPGPTPAELALLEFWIERGATPTLRVRDALPPSESRALLESAIAKPVAGSRSDPPARPDDVPRKAPRAATPEVEGSQATGPATSASQSATAPPPAGDPTPSAEEGSAEPEAVVAPPVAATSGPVILADKCEKCHGASKRKGGLRVDSLAALLRGGEGGPALVPGDPDRSEIVRRVRLPLASKEHMPPKKEPQLSDAELGVLVQWVRGLRGDGSSVATTSARTEVRTSGAESAPSASEPEPDEPSATADPVEPEAEQAAASEPPAAPDPVSDSSLPDPVLLARLPARIALYEEAVAPLLSKRCGKCHTGEKPAARLRVDDYAALVDGGYSGPGIVPGKPDESFIVQRISLPATDDDVMPPDGEPGLSRDDVLLVRYWVERGASKSDELPSAELPAAIVRAAAEHVVPRRREPAPVTASAGCAACALGRGAGSARHAGLLGAALVGAFVWRVVARRRQKPARTSA